MTLTSSDVALPCPDTDALVSAHLPLAQFAVSAVAARIQLPAHVTRDDLVSAAQVALVEAARRYDPTQGASFATYATTRLNGAVLDELRSADWASRTVRADARKMEAAVDALTISLGRPPTPEEVADRLGVDPARLTSLQTNVHRALVSSLDEDTDAEDRVVDHGTPERALLARERVGYLMDAINALPGRLGEVIERNFFAEESLTQIAEDLDLTLSRVSQMRAQALRLLGAALGEVLDGRAAVECGGVRARNAQREYVTRVATASPDYRTRLAPRPRTLAVAG